jgi:hypothetical protein
MAGEFSRDKLRLEDAAVGFRNPGILRTGTDGPKLPAATGKFCILPDKLKTKKTETRTKGLKKTKREKLGEPTCKYRVGYQPSTPTLK